nr:immunoglobulin heavy chain junction region [Macaca mulatta]MOX38300.1 immunoglobulin heavy chain junction region [Macaca mulatta]MOX38937.1 immunoglobulin heavy chain junction region [Macaca mulatta]MOX38976.1 immunoglobulin heavy chain junction region [Macaca mulatta]MOX39009.1 immunoglobulin heavy chain junction region [Macaca mulatta]
CVRGGNLYSFGSPDYW